MMQPRIIRTLLLVTGLCVVVIVSQKSTTGVPYRAIKVPDWWFTGKTAGASCYKASDCPEGYCCARPIMSANSYCIPIKQRGDVCDASPLMLDLESGVYFSDCPCAEDLQCVSLQTRSVCVNLRSLNVHKLDRQRLHRLSFSENT